LRCSEIFVRTLIGAVYMYSRSLTCFLVSTVLIWLVGSGGADIFNGGFELSEPVNSFGVKPPTGWKSSNYTHTVSRLEMDLIDEERTDDWSEDIVKYGLEPYEGDYLALLSTESNLPRDEIGYAKLSQEITIQGGERISGVFFFGACDYLPFDDYAEIRLMPDPNTMPDPNNIMLAKISISTPGIGSFASTEGWEYFEYVFSEQEAGKYTLVLGVYDELDLVWNSYLAVDALRLCQAPDNGDVNHDCDVDLQDFSLLASDWLKDCADPNEFCHPNTELSGDDIVDFGDLDLFLTDWLFQP
jgi:hypothetical protein